MTVTALNRVRGGISLHLDGAYRLTLHPGAVGGLSVGQPLEEEQLEELARDSALLSAKARAMRLLSQRSYSSRGLFEKLAEQDGEEAARAAVGRMDELGCLDDGDYARRYAAQCLRKGLSPGLTARKLAEKGIERELIEEILAEGEEEPEEAIARIIRRKYLSAIGDEKGLRRTQNALLRLGYRHGEIRAALQLLEDESHYE